MHVFRIQAWQGLSLNVTSGLMRQTDPNRTSKDVSEDFRSTLLRCFLRFFLLQFSQHVSDRRSLIIEDLHVLIHVFD